jgi:hypothetical protein
MSSSCEPLFKPSLVTPPLLLRLHSKTKTNATQTKQLVICLDDTINVAQVGDMGIRTSEQCIALGRQVGLPPDAHRPYNEEGPCNYTIHLGGGTQEGPMIGMIKLLQPQDDTPPQIGWVMLQAYCGKGYATERGGEALWYWREEFRLDEIVAVICTKNSVSVNIARKLEFEVGGRIDGDEREVRVLKGMRVLEQGNMERLLS